MAVSFLPPVAAAVAGGGSVTRLYRAILDPAGERTGDRAALPPRRRLGVELLGFLHLLLAFQHHQAVGVLHHRDGAGGVQCERLPEHLPAVETIVDPDEVKADPAAWRCMGEEVTEQLDYEPARFLRRRLIRRKYVRRDHPFQAPVIAPLHLLQERCVAAPGLLAAFVDGAPQTLHTNASGRYQLFRIGDAVEGRNIHADYASLRSRIGMVPQDDVVHGQLTVNQALMYAAELRLLVKELLRWRPHHRMVR